MLQSTSHVRRYRLIIIAQWRLNLWTTIIRGKNWLSLYRKNGRPDTRKKLFVNHDTFGEYLGAWNSNCKIYISETDKSMLVVLRPMDSSIYSKLYRHTQRAYIRASMNSQGSSWMPFPDSDVDLLKKQKEDLDCHRRQTRTDKAFAIFRRSLAAPSDLILP